MSLRGTGGSLTPQHQVGGTPLVSPKVNTKGQQLAQALGVAFQTASTAGVGLLNEMNAEGVQKALADGIAGEDFKDEKSLFNMFEARKKAWNKGAGQYDSTVVVPRVVSQFKSDNLIKVQNGEWTASKYNAELSKAIDTNDSIRNLDDAEYQLSFTERKNQILGDEQVKAIAVEREFLKGDNIRQKMSVFDTELQTSLFKANRDISMEDLVDPEKRIGARLKVSEMDLAEQNAYHKQWSEHIRPLAQEKVDSLVESGLMTKTEAQIAVYKHLRALSYRTNNVGILDYIEEEGQDGFKPSLIKEIRDDAVSSRYHIVANTNRANAQAERNASRQSRKNTQRTIIGLVTDLEDAQRELEATNAGIAEIGVSGYKAGEKIEERIADIHNEFDKLSDDPNVDPQALRPFRNLIKASKDNLSNDRGRSKALTDTLINQVTRLIKQTPQGERADFSDFHDKVDALFEANAFTATDVDRLKTFYSEMGILQGSFAEGSVQPTSPNFARSELIGSYMTYLEGNDGLKRAYLSTAETPRVKAVQDEYIGKMTQAINTNGVGWLGKKDGNKWISSRENNELVTSFYKDISKAVEEESKILQEASTPVVQTANTFGLNTTKQDNIELVGNYQKLRQQIRNGETTKALAPTINLMFDKVDDQEKRKEILADLGIKDPIQQEKYLLGHAIDQYNLEHELGEDLQWQLFGGTVPLLDGQIPMSTSMAKDNISENVTTLVDTFKKFYSSPPSLDLDKSQINLNVASNVSNRVAERMFDPLNKKLEGISAYLDTLDERAIEVVRDVINKRHDLVNSIDEGTKESRELLEAITIGQASSIADSASDSFQEYASTPENVNFDREFNRIMGLNAKELAKEFNIGINRVPSWILQATLLNPNVDKNSESYKAIEKEIKRRNKED